MLRVLQRGDRHDPKDLTIGLRFEGPFDAMVPGEAIKNLVHRVVREQEHAAAAIESLALHDLRSEILARHSGIGLARVEIAEQPWSRLDAGGKAQGQAFTTRGGRAADCERQQQRHARSRSRPGSRTWSCCARVASRRRRAANPPTNRPPTALQRLFIADDVGALVVHLGRHRVRAVPRRRSAGDRRDLRLAQRPDHPLDPAPRSPKWSWPATMRSRR